MEFAVFMIHALADEWGKPYGFVYKILNDSGILDDYIVQFYDVFYQLFDRNEIYSVSPGNRYLLQK